MTLEDGAQWKRGTDGSPGHSDNGLNSGGGLVAAGAASVLVSITEVESLPGGVEEKFGALLLIDHEMHRRAHTVTKLLEGLGAAGAQGEVQADLELEEKWLRENLDDVAQLDTGEDEASAILRYELVGNMKNLLTAVRSIKKTLAARTPEDL